MNAIQWHDGGHPLRGIIRKPNEMVKPLKDNEIAAAPSYRKHTEDLSNLRPSKKEITEALRFVMSIDDSDPRKDDLRIVMKELGFDFDEIQYAFEKKGKPRR